MFLVALVGAAVLAASGFASVTGGNVVIDFHPDAAPKPPVPLAHCSPGWYTNKFGSCVEPPDQNLNGTARCCDGTESHSQHRSGTCSGHGGVCEWNSLRPGYSDQLANRSEEEWRWA